jgi:two-component system, NarL family, sensor histidine kinase DesK
MLVFQPAFDPNSGAFAWAVTGLTVALFVPLYLVAVRGSSAWWDRWSPLASVLLAGVVFPVNSGATVLLVYAASFVGGTRDRRTAYRWFVALSLIAPALTIVARVEMPFALAVGMPIVFVWVVGIAVLEEVERDREAARLRVDNARIAHLSTATERERLARDLHDVTGQSLTSIVVRAQLIARLARDDPQAAAAQAEEVERVARAALDDIRGTLGGWRQVVLADELASARAALEAADIEVVVDRDGDLQLAPSVEQAIGLAVREAVTNVIRHAGARRCVIRLGRDAGQLVLEVVDDGAGGDPRDGGGLAGMAERIGALGGRVERSTTGGTTLRVAVPTQVVGSAASEGRPAASEART